MGRLFARLFNEAAYPVSIYDLRDGPIDWEKAARHDVVMLAVPMDAVEDVARNLGPYTKPDGLVTDISSLKQAPVESMLRHCRGEIVGCHPLFGPAVETLKGHPIFVSPVRSNLWKEWLGSFFEDQGALVVDIDPIEHDKLMAVVQALRHFILLCFGKSLMKLDFDLAADLPVSGRWFTQLTSMMTHQLHQPPELYADMAVKNPWVRHTIEAFKEGMDELLRYYRSGDRDALAGCIKEIADATLPNLK
jgi:prephenate dehydrogenase